MTPDEKAIIDAKREGYVRGRTDAIYRKPDIFEEGSMKRTAEQLFPYPPAPVVWREAVDGQGNAYRRMDGEWRMRYPEEALGPWRPVAWMTDEFAMGLARCVTEPTVQEGEG